jgi:hypothetical protein
VGGGTDLEEFAPGCLGVMTINYQASLTGTQVKGETPVLILTLTQATIVTAVFGADEDTVDKATGIETIQTESTGADTYYDLTGKALKAPAKGVNIVKKADGTVKKVMIK